MKLLTKVRDLFEVQTYPELEAAAKRQREKHGTSAVILPIGIIK